MKAPWVSKALLLAAPLTAACEAPPSSVATAGKAPWSEVIYHLDWRLEATEGAAGWETTTNLGYTVQVDEGRVVLGALTLEPCPTDPDTPGQQLQALHEETPDPATLPGSYIEPITPPTARRFAPIEVPPTAYCRISYRAARAIGVTDGIDVYPEMEQKTLSIKGRLRSPGASEWVPLLIETEFAFWHTTALPDVDSEAVTISLYRDLPRLFDEVDFGAWTARKIESRVTENLVRHTTIEVHETR